MTPPPPSVALPTLLTPHQAAASIGVCHRTLWANMHPVVVLPVIRIGKRTFINAADLVRLTSCKQGASRDCR